jgi:hypothetical protein
MTISLCMDSEDASPVRFGSAAIAVSLGGFLVLIVLAMMAYPGGTAWDASTRGHDFWLNYLCDLERETALNGEANVLGARLAQSAMFLLGLGAVPFWWSMPRLFEGGSGLATAVRWLGTVSFWGMMGVAFLPSDRFGSFHPFLMALAGVPGLAAAACSIAGLARKQKAAAAIGAVAMVVAAVDLALYAKHLSGPDAGPMAIAVLERLSLILVLVWMSVVAWRGR